jgi:hypothetical protein
MGASRCSFGIALDSKPNGKSSAAIISSSVNVVIDEPDAAGPL